jgi:CPA1 family monovalent cation:H+ antiporter
MGERRVLEQEKSAIVDAIRTGAIANEIGERLIEEADLKLDRVRSGESTVKESREGYTEFCRRRAREFGLDVDESTRPDDATTPEEV